MSMKALNQFLSQKLVLWPLFLAGKATARYMKHCEALDRLQANEIDAIQMEQFRRLLSMAIERTDYYRDAYRFMGKNVSELSRIEDLGSLPMLEKTDLRNNPLGSFISRRTQFSQDSITAGSSGSPVTVRHSFRWWCQSLARRARLFRRHGLDFGSREGRLWGRGARDQRSLLTEVMGNRRIFQFLARSDHELVDELQELIEFNPDYLYGYSSLILNAARAIERHGREGSLNISAVIRTAENMTCQQSEFVSRVFRCPVINEYGCSEVEIMGFDCELGRCHVEASHVLLEAVPDNSGQTEAVVTDLDNFVMPLIRYRVGDYIEIDQSPCGCGRNSAVIRSVQGRTTGQIVRLPDGSKQHAVKFAYMMEEICEAGFNLEQFRIRQISPHDLLFQLEGVPLDQRQQVEIAISHKVAAKLSPLFRINYQFAPIDYSAETKHTYFVPLEQRE